MKKSRLLGAFCAFSLAVLATSTHAVLVDVGGTQYDIITIDGTFNALQTNIESQPWWGDINIARDAAFAVNTSLGTNSVNTDFGPLFAYGKPFESVAAVAWLFVDPLDIDTDAFAVDPTQSVTWAVVAPEVPIPAAVWLFGSGLLGLVGIARRKKT